MQALQFIKSLEKGKLPSVVLMVGEERQLHGMVIRKLAKLKLGDDHKGVQHIDGSETSLNKIIDEASSAGLFADQRVIAVHNAEGIKAPSGSPQLKTLERYLESPDADLTLIFSAESVNRNHQPYKLLASKGQSVECGRIKGNDLRTWVNQVVVGNGYRFAGPALERALDLLGVDMLMISRALEKIMLYCGERKQIEFEDVEKTLGSLREHAMWELTAAIGKRDRPTALRLLANLLNEGKHPLQLTTTLQYQFRQLLSVKALLLQKHPPQEVARIAGIRYFADRVLAQAKAYNANELLNAYTILFELENAVKSAGIDERFLLENSIIRICSTGAAAGAGRG